eukprot:487190-Rhodomonas_salina.1
MHAALKAAQERELGLRETLLRTRGELARSTQNAGEQRAALEVAQAALGACEQENDALRAGAR